MSLSLIGIIFVQAYYINNILKNKEQEDIIIITLLSLVFTMIIIIGYMSAVYQLIQQRKISQMKSDFINNMTHEFKTPIATINLALDAIKNPKIFNNKAKVWDYISMIKEENKRMNAINLLDGYISDVEPQLTLILEFVKEAYGVDTC